MTTLSPVAAAAHAADCERLHAASGDPGALLDAARHRQLAGFADIAAVQAGALLDDPCTPSDIAAAAHALHRSALADLTQARHLPPSAERIPTTPEENPTMAMSIVPAATPATAASDPLVAVVDGLEACLHRKPPCRPARTVQTPADLVPLVLADRVVWRHRVNSPEAMVIVPAIAQAFDAAYSAYCQARKHAPLSWQPMLVQVSAYTALRSRLDIVAQGLDWGLEIARNSDIALTIHVGRRYVRDERFRRVPLTTATLTLLG